MRFDPIFDDIDDLSEIEGEDEEFGFENPGDSGFELIAVNPNPDAAEAMSRAHELREDEGLSMSEALSQAWDEIKGESDDYDGEGGYSMDNPKQTDMGKWLMWAVVGYAGWVGIKYLQTKVWNFQPWKSMGGFQRRPALPAAPPVHQTTTRELDALTQSVKVVFDPHDPSKEIVSLIQR